MALTTVKSDQIQTSVALAGSPTTTTQSASDNSTKIATTAYVETAVANLVASAPSALNTLDELAAALNDDASFSTTVTNSIATKLPLAGGSLTGSVGFRTTANSNYAFIALQNSSLTHGGYMSIQGGTATGLEINASASSFSGTIFLAKQSQATTGGYLARFVNSAGDKMVVETGGNVGIGTTNVTDLLTVGGVASPRIGIQSTSGSGDAGIEFGDNSDDNVGYLVYDHSANAFRFGTNTVERLRIHNNGYVGINTSGATPSHPLEINTSAGGQSDAILITNQNTATNNTAGILFAPSNGIAGARIEALATEDFSTTANRTADLLFYTRKDGTLAEKMRIDSSGNTTFTGTGTFAGGSTNNNDDANILTLNASQHARLLVDTSSTSGHRATLALESNGNELTLGTTGSYSYLTSVGNLQISGGNVLVGTTSNSVYNDASGTGIALNTGEIQIAGTGTPLYVNRQGSDGTILDLRKGGSPVGIFASDSGSMLMGSGDVGVYFDAPSDRILPMNMSTPAVRNDAIDIGGNPHRFKHLYLSGDVKLGGNVVMASGQGIDFSATSDGTSTANRSELFHDYEEGTWTPTVYVGSTQQTIVVHRSTYVKIGDLVHCTFSFYASGSNFGSSGGNVELRGFPFASSSTAEESCGSIMINLANWNGASHTWYVLYKYSGEANDGALFYGSGDNVGWDALGANQVPQNTSFIGTITFRVFT